MTKEELYNQAARFRHAIEKATDLDMFPIRDRMRRFPKDCCDDTADLFTHYIYVKFKKDSIRIDGRYNDKDGMVCGHSWQTIDGFVVDLTGDQFANDQSLRVKTVDIYVGPMDEFHKQFEIVRQEHSCGIMSLPNTCRERMNMLYDVITECMQ